MTFDYESVRDRLIETLQSKSSWAEILPFSTNRRLLDTIAEGIAELGSYDDYLTREQKWDLAQNLSSLLTNSRFLGYDAHRKIGATGNIRISVSSSFDSTPSKIVVIPKWTRFSNGDDIEFTTTATENMLTTDNYLDVAVVQGIPKTETFIAAGDNYEEVEIVNDSFENVYYDIEVNSVEWTEVDDLNNYGSTDTVYTLKNKTDFSGVDIRFGNNIFGKKLSAGDTVTVKYVETLGIEGNVSSTGIVTTVESTIYDIDSDEVTIYCTNTARLDGGQDEESVSDIRTNGINTFQAGEKAVTKNDYKIKIEEKSYVQNSVTWGAYETNIIANNDPWTFIASTENVIKISAFTPAGEQLTTSQKTEIIEYLNPYKPPEDIVQFQDVDFILLAFNIDAYVSDDSYVLSDVKTDIITAIQTAYALTAVDFYEHIYDTVWKKTVSDVDGVGYHNSYIEMIEYDTFDSAYAATVSLPIYEIKTESVKIYVREGSTGTYDYVGIDDGAGSFNAQSGYDLTGSSINYDTGALTLNVLSGLSATYSDYSIKVYYRTIDENEEENIVLKAINQITKIEEITNVTASYQSILGE